MPFPSLQLHSSHLRFLGAGAALSLILLAFLVFGRGSSSYLGFEHGLGAGSGYTLKSPAGSGDSGRQCGEAGMEAETNSTGQWEFDVRRDGDNHGLLESQCLSAFPKLFGEIDRAADARGGGEGEGRAALITFREVDAVGKGGEDGLVRGIVKGGDLYVVNFGDMPYTYSRGKATLYSLNRALAAFPDRRNLPDIEFVLSTDDFSTGKSPTWSYSKRPEDEGVWLMPDFGYWSWPEVKVGSYKEVRQRIADVDGGDGSSKSNRGLRFKDKKKQLAWRGSVATNIEIRGSLLNASRGKSWASIREINWNDPEHVRANLLPMEEYCRYMFLAHTEGRSFSGRGKYLLNCRSVMVSHKLQWLEAHHGALISSGPDANYVEVERDFSDLERKIEFLIDNPETAERIAENAVRTFRDRYLTPAAESCYWRHLIRRYAASCEFEPVLFETSRSGKKVARAVHFESWVLNQG
ncbi:glycosyl transferase family 90-domain-containing protein [Aspergillus varians]